MYEDLLSGTRPVSSGGSSSSRGGSSQGRPAASGIQRARSGGEQDYRSRAREGRSGEHGWGEETRAGNEARPRRVSAHHPRHSHLLDSPTPSFASNTSSSSSSRSTSPKYHHHPISNYPYPPRSVSSSSSSLGLPQPVGLSSTQSWPSTQPYSSSSRLPQSVPSHVLPSDLPPAKWTHDAVQPLPSLADLSSSLPPLSSLVPNVAPPASSPPGRYYISQPVTPFASEDGNMLNRFVVRI